MATFPESSGAGTVRIPFMRRQGAGLNGLGESIHGVDGPRWVWSAEVMELIDLEMARRSLSLGELARRAGARYAVDPESVERRLRSARRSRSVMDVHTADRYLVLVGRHITDIPCYRLALVGELAPELWPRRGGLLPERTSESPRAAGRSHQRPSRVALA